MLGMIGIIINDKNQIVNTTQITNVVKAGEMYLCRFLNDPPFNKICTVDEIQGWILFEGQDDANHWVKMSQAPKPDPLASVTPITDEPHGEPDIDYEDPIPGDDPDLKDGAFHHKPDNSKPIKSKPIKSKPIKKRVGHGNPQPIDDFMKYDADLPPPEDEPEPPGAA